MSHTSHYFIFSQINTVRDVLFCRHLPSPNQHLLHSSFACSCHMARISGNIFSFFLQGFLLYKIYWTNKDWMRSNNSEMVHSLVHKHVFNEKPHIWSHPSLIKLNWLKRKTMCYFCNRVAMWFLWNTYPTQIRGDCRAFVSAEALFSSRFMIVARTWQELVWLLLTHWFIPLF